MPREGKMFASTDYDYDYHFQISQYGMMPTEASPEMEKPAKWKLSYSNEPAPACPRCASPNTKFCYYNNYSLSQPRYFCKGCRRYWTKGGTLRNVPFGGGCRKTRRRANTNYKKSGRGNERIDRNQDGEFTAGPVSGGGSEIDLAAVFANFLNDKSPSSSSTTTNTDQESSPSDESNGVATTIHPSDCFDWNICQENDSIPGFYQNMEETQEQELLRGGDEFLNKMSQEDEFGPGMHALQDLLNDEEIQDVLWSDNWHPFDLDRSDLFSKH